MGKRSLFFLLVAAAVFAISATASAEMGVGVDWTGDGIVPNMVLPIKMQSGLIIEPMLGFDRTEESSSDDSDSELAAGTAQDESSSPAFTQIRFGLRVEKAMREGTSPLFGAGALVHFNSPSDVFVLTGLESEELDSWTDFQVRVYIGGTVSVADNFDVVGSWGPALTLAGERKTKDDTVLAESATNFGSVAQITMRWWLWGMQ